MSRHSSLLFALCVTALVMSPLGAAKTRTEGPRAAAATLKKVSSRLEARTGLVAIEASTPVPYVSVQPDARTTIVEMRDVNAAGFADDLKIDQRHPVDAVKVESALAADGTAIARVRVTFRQPVKPRVRSSRNTIFVEADRVDGTGATTRVNLGPSTAIRDVRVTQRGTATAVTLLGTAPLIATSVQEPKEGPRRVVLNLPGVTSAVPGNTAVGRGPVERVRIGMNPTPPFDTQVTLDLSRTASYRLESSPDRNDLTVVFDEPAPDPIAALRSAASPAQPVAQAAAPQAAAPQLVAQAPQAPQLPAPVAPVPIQSQRFTGAPISIDFVDADLRDVLRFLASDYGGLNVYLDPRIQGTVNTNLRDVPWDEAFDVITSANALGYVQQGSIVRVAPLAVLAEEEAARRKVADERALAGELRTLTRSLSYAKATDLVMLLEDTVLSQRGQVQIDPRTNTVIITDLIDRIQRAEMLLTTLDRPEPQVEIEARIVQTSRDFARAIGVMWGANARAATDLGNTFPVPFPNQGSLSGRIGATQGPDAVGTAVDLGVTNPSSAIGLALGSINGAFNLDVALSALERQGNGKILSTPRVFTQNNIEAEIMQGVQIPIQTTANNTTTVTWKDAALILRVVPQITSANTVIMRIVVENGSPDFSRAIQDNPPINTQRANTQLTVADGETTVIGGIFVSSEQATQSRTPGLHRVPLLGWLFKRNEVTDESRELLIFITPRIIRL